MHLCALLAFIAVFDLMAHNFYKFYVLVTFTHLLFTLSSVSDNSETHRVPGPNRFAKTRGPGTISKLRRKTDFALRPDSLSSVLPLRFDYILLGVLNSRRAGDR